MSPNQSKSIVFLGVVSCDAIAVHGDARGILPAQQPQGVRVSASVDGGDPSMKTSALLQMKTEGTQKEQQQHLVRLPFSISK